MGCCWCCMSENQKVTRVLEKIPATPMSMGQMGADGPIQKLVGRVVIAGTMPFYQPSNGMPCVFYRLRVQEQRVEYYRDSEGRRQRRYSWWTIFDQEQYTDFFLQDMATKVWINGSNRGQCKICSEWEGSYRSFYAHSMPPGIFAVIAQHGGGFSWGSSHATGRYQFQEQAFNVNEQIAACGFVMQAPGANYMQLVPINEETIENKYPTLITKEMNDLSKTPTPEGVAAKDEIAKRKLNKALWSDMKNLVHESPSVLLSDDARQYPGINIQLIPDLPPWMINANAQWGQPMQAAPQVQGMQ